MAEEKYSIPAKPEYSADIRKLQDSDPANASTVFNPLFQRIIENVAAVKNEAEDARTASQILAARQYDLDIPASGWSPETEGSYRYKLDVPVEGVTADEIPDVTVLAEGEGAALACGLCPRAETLEGAVRFRAVKIPEGTITTKLTLLRDKTGTVAVAQPPLATAAAPGLVKPGKGLLVGEDGTLNVDTATGEDYTQMMDRLEGTE